MSPNNPHSAKKYQEVIKYEIFWEYMYFCSTPYELCLRINCPYFWNDDKMWISIHICILFDSNTNMSFDIQIKYACITHPVYQQLETRIATNAATVWSEQKTFLEIPSHRYEAWCFSVYAVVKLALKSGIGVCFDLFTGFTLDAEKKREKLCDENFWLREV